MTPSLNRSSYRLAKRTALSSGLAIIGLFWSLQGFAEPQCLDGFRAKIQVKVAQLQNRLFPTRYSHDSDLIDNLALALAQSRVGSGTLFESPRLNKYRSKMLAKMDEMRAQAWENKIKWPEDNLLPPGGLAELARTFKLDYETAKDLLGDAQLLHRLRTQKSVKDLRLESFRGILGDNWGYLKPKSLEDAELEATAKLIVEALRWIRVKQSVKNAFGPMAESADWDQYIHSEIVRAVDSLMDGLSRFFPQGPVGIDRAYKFLAVLKNLDPSGRAIFAHAPRLMAGVAHALGGRPIGVEPETLESLRTAFDESPIGSDAPGFDSLLRREIGYAKFEVALRAHDYEAIDALFGEERGTIAITNEVRFLEELDRKSAVDRLFDDLASDRSDLRFKRILNCLYLKNIRGLGTKLKDLMLAEKNPEFRVKILDAFLEQRDSLKRAGNDDPGLGDLRFLVQFNTVFKKPYFEIDRVAFTPDGNFAAIATGGEGVQLWDLEAKSPVSSVIRVSGYLKSMRFSPDGRKLIVFRESFATRTPFVEILELRNEGTTSGIAKEALDRGFRRLGVSSEVQGIDVSRKTGQILMFSAREARSDLSVVEIFREDANAGEKIAEIKVFGLDIRWAGFVKDGKEVLVLQSDGLLSRFDIETGKRNRSRYLFASPPKPGQAVTSEQFEFAVSYHELENRMAVSWRPTNSSDELALEPWKSEGTLVDVESLRPANDYVAVGEQGILISSDGRTSVREYRDGNYPALAITRDGKRRVVPISLMPIGDRSPVTSIALSPNGANVVVSVREQLGDGVPYGRVMMIRL